MKIKSLLSLVLVFAMAFSFVACDILFIEGEDSDIVTDSTTKVSEEIESESTTTETDEDSSADDTTAVGEETEAEPSTTETVAEQSTKRPTEQPTEESAELETYPVETPPTMPPEPDSEISISQALELGYYMGEKNYTEEKYYIRGIVTDVYMPSNGSMIITDSNGYRIAVYCTSNEDGTVYYQDMMSRPVVGDEVLLYGVIGQYSGSPQMKYGWIISFADNTPDEGDDIIGSESTETTTEQITEAPTEAPEENIGYIGSIYDVNGLGPNGKKVTATNNYSTYSPHTNNPNVIIYPPCVEGQFDYMCRSLSLNGWAIVEGGNGEMVWSYDGGKTWMEISNASYSDQSADLKPFATVAGFKYEEYCQWDANFALTIDLSSLEDNSYVNIWVGRRNAYGKAVAIFEFAEILIGDEYYVADIHEECGAISRDDNKYPINILSLDTCASTFNIQDSKGRIDRLRVLNYSNGLYGADTSIANNMASYTWNKVIQFLEKDIAAKEHIFTLEGWVSYTKDIPEENISFSGVIYRNGEILKYLGGTTIPRELRPDIGAALGISRYNAYKIWLGVCDLQSGDTVHLLMTVVENGEKTTYCMSSFTVMIVPDSTDITVYS